MHYIAILGECERKSGGEIQPSDYIKTTNFSFICFPTVLFTDRQEDSDKLLHSYGFLLGMWQADIINQLQYARENKQKLYKQ